MIYYSQTHTSTLFLIIVTIGINTFLYCFWYCPDLEQSDFYLFTHLKKWLVSQWFETDDELQTDIYEWFNTLAAFFFDTYKQSGKIWSKICWSGANMLENNANAQPHFWLQ